MFHFSCTCSNRLFSSAIRLANFLFTIGESDASPEPPNHCQHRKRLITEAAARERHNLETLDKDTGTTDRVNHWTLLKGTGKLAFALQLKCDKDANFMSVTESHAQTRTTNNTML